MNDSYKKPLVLMNEELAEGVYAASGSVAGDCWILGYKETQDYVDGVKIYEISAKHVNTVSHFSEALTIKFVFNTVITTAYLEQNENYDITGVGSNTLLVTRRHHANGEYSGDDTTYKLFVGAGSEASTKGIAILSETFVSCDKQPTPNYPIVD